MKLITTSWDDGHPLDFRLAELLNKYSVKGTFYVPQSNAENEVMSEKQLQELGQKFEIGGHTLSHVRLHASNAAEHAREIRGCYSWQQSITGKPPVSFCFPGGIYNQNSVEEAYRAGFKILRTTELLSTKITSGRSLLPTTVQVYQHNSLTYSRHLIRRGKINSMANWLKSGSETNMLKLTDYYLNQISKSSGCFHLWGHSWEIEKEGLWNKLETVLQHLAARTDFITITNGELINYR